MTALVLTLAFCQDFCTARFYEGGILKNNECYCLELVEQDTPPAMLISGTIREKTNQAPSDKKSEIKIDLAGYDD